VSASRAAFTDQTLLFGAGAAGPRLAAELETRGWRRAAVFRSPSAAVQPPPGVEVVAIFDRIRDQSPIMDTEAIAAELAGKGLDLLLVLGGGKVGDTAKGVAVLLAEGGRFVDHTYTFTPPDDYRAPELARPKLPLVAVATTLAGAELSGGAGGTTAEGVKRAVWDPRLRARVAAYDPAVLALVPRDVLVSTGMNALHHCSEGLYSKTRNPVSDALAIEATRRLGRGLRRVAAGAAEEGDYEALGEGAALAGLVIANARVAIGHAACHVLGARYGIPHGVGNSIMLPASARFNRSVAEREVARFTEALGAEPAAFQAEIGAPARLRDHGVTREDLPRIAEELMGERGLYFNPRRVTSPSEVMELLEYAW
jgi:alcohol dehydrogenase class IV